jgi:hypothetical protein
MQRLRRSLQKEREFNLKEIPFAKFETFGQQQNINNQEKEEEKKP